MTLGVEMRVCFEFDFQEQVAIRPAIEAGTALAGKAYALAGGDALGDGDVYRLGPLAHFATAVQFRHGEGQCAGRALIGVAETDGEARAAVLATHLKPIAAAWLLAGSSAEYRREELAEFGAVAKPRALVVEVRLMFGRRREILAVAPVRAQAVIRLALIGVLQHLISFLHVLEMRLAIGLLADVGMIFARKLAIGALDVIARRITADAQGFVIVFELHGSTRC